MMGWGQEIVAKRAALGALDDLADAVDVYLDNPCGTTRDRLVAANNKVKATRNRTSTRVDL